MYTRINNRKKLNIILILLVAVLSACYEDTSMPDDIDFMINKYPQMEAMYDEFSSRNLIPEDIDVSYDVASKEFPSFIQWDKRWGYLTYIDSFMAVKGNVPAAMSSIYSFLTKDTKMNPYEMGKFFEKEKWTIDTMGTTWQAIEQGSIKLGLTYSVIENSDIRIILPSFLRQVSANSCSHTPDVRYIHSTFCLSWTSSKRYPCRTWDMPHRSSQNRAWCCGTPGNRDMPGIFRGGRI